MEGEEEKGEMKRRRRKREVGDRAAGALLISK